MKINREIFDSELKKMLDHKNARVILVVIFFVSFIALSGIAFYHDTYFQLFELRELAKMDVWFRICLSICAIAFITLIIWPIGSVLMAYLYAIPQIPRNKTDNSQEMGGSVQLEINRIALRKLFSQDFSDDKFLVFCQKLESSQTSFKLRDYGKLADIILFHSPYCSKEKNYMKRMNYEDVPKFTSYCKDFFSALGITTSNYNNNYYTEAQEKVINEFGDIIDYKK